MHFARVEIKDALAQCSEAISYWSALRAFDGAPAFSGGVLDAWPRCAVQALSICRAEEASIDAYMRAVG